MSSRALMFLWPIEEQQRLPVFFYRQKLPEAFVLVRGRTAVCRQQSEHFQPFPDFGHPFLFVGETVGESPAVSAFGITNECGRYVVGYQRLIVAQAVFGTNGSIVAAVDNQSRRCEAVNVEFVAEVSYQFVGRLSAQQLLARTVVGDSFLHADNGIEQQLEVGA